MKKETATLLLLSFLFTAPANAEAVISPCSNLNSSNNILKCALENSSNIQLQKLAVDVSSKAIDAAGQRPNPVMELEGTTNTNDTATSLTLLHPIEFGGKRLARINTAKSEKKGVEIEVLKEQEEVATNTVLNLYKLRHIETELTIVKESLNTFTKISKQYQSARNLPPEQEASLAIFKLALEENKLQQTSLVNKKKLIINKLERTVGADIKVTNQILPKFKKDWPKVETSDLAGSDIQALRNNIDLAKSKYEVEKSQGWSDIAIGPKIERFSGQEEEDTTYGIALSMPIPIYQRNQGHKARAFEEVRRSELSLNLNKQNLEREKFLLHETYQQSVDSLKTTLEQNSIDSRHSQIHRLIERGFLSASLIIELHRQILDYYRTLHEHELQAVETLWRIYGLEGKILNQEIK